MAQQIQEEMDSLSVGQMVNMYEVHVRNLAEFTPEKIEELRMEVSKKLGLKGEEEIVMLDASDDELPSERLMPVMQDAEVCAITRDLGDE